MGDEWGVNRSVSQIHGLLYLAEAPMTAEDIADTLGMARSNVSNSIKELLSWNLIRRVPILGDRRDHYEAETDIWEVAARIAARTYPRSLSLCTYSSTSSISFTVSASLLICFSIFSVAAIRPVCSSI